MKLKDVEISQREWSKTVFNCSISTFRPQVFLKKTKLKLLSHCCHCLFNFPQMFLILFYDAHIVHYWRVPVASLYAVVDSFAVRYCDVMARTSCATLRSSLKSGQRIPLVCWFAPCGRDGIKAVDPIRFLCFSVVPWIISTSFQNNYF